MTEETEGFAVPRSTREINERAMSAPFASCSCESLHSTRFTFTAIPNAVLISMPIRFFQPTINRGYVAIGTKLRERSIRHRMTHLGTKDQKLSLTNAKNRIKRSLQVTMKQNITFYLHCNSNIAVVVIRVCVYPSFFLSPIA